MTHASNDSPGDLLYGVPAIAAFLNIKQRAVYHLAATAGLPVFKVRGKGRKTCARRSSLNAWLDQQEAAGNE